MTFLLSFFWFTRTTKVVLFYLYLWQIKEYHIGRFLDHFRTEKGKRLIFNKINGVKLALFIAFLIYLLARKEMAIEWFLGWFLGILIVLYLVELFFILKNLFQKRFRKPVLTKKSGVLIGVSLLIEIIIFSIILTKTSSIYYLAFWLLVFDILVPVFVSFIVLGFQPITVLIRNQIIKKAKIKRQKHKNLIVVGITGSYGKTSTKEFLATILEHKFRVLKTKEHQNSEMGISRCILDELNFEHQVFVVEMGSYGKGGIKLLCDIVKPKIGVVTGVNEQHLALFKSMENLISAEGGTELVQSLPEDGAAIFNGDNKYCLELYKKTKVSKKLYGITSNIFSAIAGKVLQPDISAKDIKIEKEFVSFNIQTKEGKTADFKVNVLGGHNVSNILAAVLVAWGLGMELDEIAKACQKIRPEQGSIKFIKGKEDINILDASYSANPDGVMADLDYLNIYPNKKVIVMPCLIELGSSSEEVHKKIGKKIGEVCDLAIITTKERFEEIKAGAMEAGMKEDNIAFLEEPGDIFTRISVFCSSGDAVLFEGRAPKGLIERLRRPRELDDKFKNVFKI